MSNEFTKLRDEFSKKWYEVSYKANIACWNFYINSTNENMEKYQKLQEENSKLFKNKKMYKKFKNIDKSSLNKHENKQLKDILDD